MTTITDNQRAFTEALMLAILAPDEQKKDKALGLVARLSTTLSEKDIEYSKMGIEVCMDYLKRF